MEILLILLCLIIIFFWLWLISYSTSKHNYKYYKPTYEAIKNKEYIFFNENESFIVFKHKDKMNVPTWMIDDDNEILYFKEEGDIKLIKEYIHTSSAPFFDPYTSYWYKKIKKEILYHSRSIEQIREDKLNQLLK